jgi:peptidyl-prolyl cis-trans isomerase
MKAQYLIASLLWGLAVLAGCGSRTDGTDKQETHVRIETSAGTFEVKLYNETPRHRDNFLKLVREGVYDNMLFHRIVREFMVQSGDPALKPGDLPVEVDTNAYHYTLPAEIVYPRYFHKKGALAAARMGDEENPKRESSGTQFYIVTGKVFTPSELAEMRAAVYQSKVDARYKALCRERAKDIERLQKQSGTERLQAFKDSLLYEAEAYLAANPPATFAEAQKTAYTTIGGAPHLDGEYTVFGEVTEGMEVVEAIEKTRTDKGEHPLQEVFIKKMTVVGD